MTTDWRERSVNLSDLVKKLYHGPPEVRDAFTDVTFVLDDNSELNAHKLILALASPMFEAKFYGPLADKNQDTFEMGHVKHVKREITFIVSPRVALRCALQSNTCNCNDIAVIALITHMALITRNAIKASALTLQSAA